MASGLPRCAALVLAASLLVPCTGLADEVYRWVDEQGRVHFSSTPPPRGAKKWEAEKKRDKINVMGPQSNAPPVQRQSAAPPTRPTANSLSGWGMRAPKPASGAQKLPGGKSEDAWRLEANKLRGEVERLESELEKTDDGGEFYEARYRDGIRVGSENKSSRMARLERQLEEAQDRFDTFEDRARELDVPPGWLR